MQKTRRLAIVLLFFLPVTVFLFSSSAYAQTCLNTAIGQICGLDRPDSFVSLLFPVLLGMAGGIAFLLMATGAFMILLSGGNPEKVKAGQELITSAIQGLLVVIFSVFLLELIGKGILNIF